MSRSKKILFAFAGLLCLVMISCGTMSPATSPNANGVAPDIARRSLIRVTVTSQSYVFHRPWLQRRPVTQSAIGVMVPGGRVLVNGLLVANQRYIELETLDTREKQPARVAVVDYDANLALVEPLDWQFLSGRPSFALSGDIPIGDHLTVWQVKPNGDVIPDRGQVTSVDLALFSLNNFFLTYRVNGSLQYGFNNQTLPVVSGESLAGLVSRQNTSGQTIEVIATPVIRHFLKDAEDGSYQGFPTAGFHYGALSDPQLRRYIGLPDGISGIYVQKVIKGSPADKAGLQSGDVITRIGSHEVSINGQYDHPLYGQTSLVHLIRTGFFVGDTATLRVFRNGQTLDLNALLDHRRPDEYLVPPYTIDQQPEYLVVGGMIFLELSMTYLREYGNDWVTDAPIHLLYYQQNQDYLNGDHREKIVILSDVIPTPYTIGYENLSNLVALKINDQPIGKLADVRQALKTPVNGFHKIELQQHPKVIYLDPKEIPLIHQIIEQRYRIPIPPLD